MWYGAFTQAQFKIIEAMVRRGLPIQKSKDRIHCGDLTVRQTTFERLKLQKLIQSAKPRSRTLFALSPKGKRAYEEVIHHARSDQGFDQWLNKFRRHIAKLPGGQQLKQLFGKQLLVTDTPTSGKPTLVFLLEAASQKLLWKSQYTVYPQIDLWAGQSWTSTDLLAVGDLVAAILDGHSGKGLLGGNAWYARCSEGKLWNQGTRLITDWVICAHPKRVPEFEKSKHSLQERFRANLRSSLNQIISGPLAKLL